jgi:hypothetical protein
LCSLALMSLARNKRSGGRLRFQISISAPAARQWRQIAKVERRNRSNTLEVLIEREHERIQQNGKAVAA